MSQRGVFNKEQSIVLDDDILNSQNSIKNLRSSEYDKKTIKTETSNIPRGEPTNFSLNLNGEVEKRNDYGGRTTICWNCQSLLIAKKDWDVVECSKCHQLNRMPTENRDIYNRKISVGKSYGNINDPYMYGVVVCPLCESENKFAKNSTSINCYVCGNMIYLGNRLFRSNNFEDNSLMRSYDNYSPYSYMRPYGFIQIRGIQPYPPYICHHENINNDTLLKILRALKKRPKEQYIPYPIYPYYRYEEPPKKEIRYITVNDEKKKDDEYKIVIKKRKKGNITSRSSEKIKLSKNKAIEKIFFK
jgi:DNA-directed RNA polymerase subunit M/transcription elongation factor TFIIS